MGSAGRRLGILHQHLTGLDGNENAAGSAALLAVPCRAATAAAGPPVLVGGMVMDLQVRLPSPALAGVEAGALEWLLRHSKAL